MTDNMKRCTTCKEFKELTEFSKCSKHNDGLKYACKTCEAIKFKEWRDNNPDFQRTTREAMKKANDESIPSATMRGQVWTKQEDDFLREFHATEGSKTIAEALGRTYNGVTNRAHILGLRKRSDSRLPETSMSE